jgi:predicted porin
MMKWVGYVSSLILISFSSVAQQHNQLWLDFQVSYPFGNRYLIENTTSYQTVLSKNDKWRSFAIAPNFEYIISPQFDFLFEVPIAYTNQKEGANSFEISPIIGGRFHITQNRRVDTRILWRYQVRSFHQVEAADWETSNRTRLRGEIYFCVNGPNLFTDKLWYLFGDYEEFFVLDQQVNERFANRRRARLGVGYRLSYKHRFDVSYTLQSSRDEIDGAFISNDNVLQLRYKMYLNPAKGANVPTDK